MTLLFGNFSSDELLSEPLRCFYSFWLQKMESLGHLPARAHFDPIEIPTEILPYLTLFDVIQSDRGIRFHIRLVGTGIVAETGQDTTGSFLDEMPNTDAISERAIWIVTNKKPVYVDNQPINWTSMDFKSYSALGVPLATDGTNVDKIFYQMAFS